MEFYDVVSRRHMVRSFLDAPVSSESIERILNAARRGPSAGYSQGVEFVVITDPDVRSKLSPPPEVLATKGVRNFIEEAPVVVLVCVSAEIYKSRYREGDKARARDGADDDDLWFVPYWHTDAGAAMMLILLAAVDEGLSAGVAGVMRADGQARMQRALGMPDTHIAIALIAIGHAAADARNVRSSANTRKRRPLDEIVHRNRW